MGVAAADFDSDGDNDLFMTHLAGESNTLYVNNGSGQFRDVSARSGLGGPSRPLTAFGTAWVDYDSDGWVDIVVVNGAVQRAGTASAASSEYPLGQPNQLFRNHHDGSFQEVSAAVGETFLTAETSRGAAFGDIDNDGDTDLVVSNNNGPVRLFRNDAPTQGHWVGLRMIGTNGQRDMLGARVDLVSPNGKSHRRRVHTDGSYCSASDPRVLFSMADDERIDHLVVHWPSGRIERFAAPPIDKYTTVCESTGLEIR